MKKRRAKTLVCVNLLGELELWTPLQYGGWSIVCGWLEGKWDVVWSINGSGDDDPRFFGREIVDDWVDS